MVKIMKSQKVVIVLAGRYAGRKALVIKVSRKKRKNNSWNPWIFIDYHLVFSPTMKEAMNEAMVMLWSLVLLVIHER